MLYFYYQGGIIFMNANGVKLQVLPGYQLKLFFFNGSEAIIDMKNRTHGIRFGRLSDPRLFSTARLSGSEVIWDNTETCIRASINELLDSMQMD